MTQVSDAYFMNDVTGASKYHNNIYPCNGKDNKNNAKGCYRSYHFNTFHLVLRHPIAFKTWPILSFEQ